MDASADLKQKVRLFLHSYVGYTDAKKLSSLYLSIIEKSTSTEQLDENVRKTTMNNNTALDQRSAEAIRNLHQRIKRLPFT